jgi:hypothetical protein
MAMYEVFIEKAAFKRLRNIPEKDYQKLMASIANLAKDPRPLAARNLKADHLIGFEKGAIGLFMKLMTIYLPLLLLKQGTGKIFMINCL